MSTVHTSGRAISLATCPILKKKQYHSLIYLFKQLINDSLENIKTKVVQRFDVANIIIKVKCCIVV